MSSVAFETQRAALAGVVAIPVTPFAADGTVDRQAHRVLLRRLVDGGITTLTPNGNTGEFYALTPEERRLVTEATADEVGDRAVLLAGVGHDVPTAVASARRARDLGIGMVMACVACGVSTLPPITTISSAATINPTRMPIGAY